MVWNLLRRIRCNEIAVSSLVAAAVGRCAHNNIGGTKMNSDQLKGNWTQAKGKIKENWGRLTDDQIDVIAGQRDQLVGEIQKQYGKSREVAEQEVDQFMDRI